jgi:hypothetical protein
MLVSSWHFLLPIFPFFTAIHCDGTIASVQLFSDRECSQARSSAFEAQLNVCIVIPGAVGVMVEGNNPCDSGFIFITGYFDTSCGRGITNSGPDNTIPDRCFAGGGLSAFTAIQIYCIAQERPAMTTTLTTVSATPSTSRPTTPTVSESLPAPNSPPTSVTSTTITPTASDIRPALKASPSSASSTETTPTVSETYPPLKASSTSVCSTTTASTVLETRPTSTMTPSPFYGLDTSDKIAISIGVPVGTATILGTWFSWKLYHHKKKRITQHPLIVSRASLLLRILERA